MRKNERYYFDKLDELLNKSVKRQLISDVPLGVFLSGGLDSTLVAHELKNILGEVDSFTNEMNPNVVIGEDFNSDANCAKQFADDIGLNHHRIETTPNTVETYWTPAMQHMEQPVYNMSMPMYYYTNNIYNYILNRDAMVLHQN